MRDMFTLTSLGLAAVLFVLFGIEHEGMYALMAFLLMFLDLLGQVAVSEQNGYDRAYANHIHDWSVRQSWVNTGNYVHALYEEYKYVGYNNNKAHALMQEDIKGFKIGDLYKPFDVKPTLTTRILMTKVGGAK